MFSKLALFELSIHYLTRRSNKATDAYVGIHMMMMTQKLRMAQTVMRLKSFCTHQSVQWLIDSYLDTTKIPDDLKKEVLSISHAVKPIIEKEDAEEIEGMLNSVSVLN